MKISKKEANKYINFIVETALFENGLIERGKMCVSKLQQYINHTSVSKDVIKVLSEYTGKEVKYVFADGNSTIALNYFYYEDDTNYRFKYQYLCSNMSGKICLYDMNYPSSILKIIAEFYDSLEE